MFPHQRRDLAAGNNFTFSNSLPKESSGLSHSDELEYDTWAARIKDQYNYFGKPSDVKPGAWTRRSPRNKGYSNPDEGEFKWLQAKADQDDESSSTPSPELWKKAEPPVIHSAETSPVRSHGYNYNYSHISHSARAQTIAKYRQEMLDLVRGMPEAAYELSLRDIVESPKITTPLKESKEDEEEDNKPVEGKNNGEKKKKKKTMSRSESMDTGGGGGPLLKMFIPRIPDALRRRKSSTDIKVSPKPSLGDGERSGSEKSIDREWWSAEFEPMNSSSGSSSSNDSTGSRRRNR